jgi:hypothetical protein
VHHDETKRCSCTINGADVVGGDVCVALGWAAATDESACWRLKSGIYDESLYSMTAAAAARETMLR